MASKRPQYVQHSVDIFCTYFKLPIKCFSYFLCIQASTAGYGPDDFIVETVNLDKNFFYQFFTSKPMIIDTDVVTSTSVKVR